MPKLDSEVKRSIRAICEHADMLVKMKEYSFAISKYFEALSIIPDPKREYPEATWIYTSIGETYWKLRKYHDAGASFLNALTSVGGDQSTRLTLRVGECLLECGDTKHFSEYLCKAYMLEGEKAFAGEDPKYFEAIRYEVEGAPDDDEFGDDYPMDDIYLVDSVLGDSSMPAEYLEGDDPVDPERYENTDSDPYDDETAEIIDSREQQYNTDVETGRYFDDDDVDVYADDGYGEEYYDDDDNSPFKRFFEWFVSLFK